MSDHDGRAIGQCDHAELEVGFFRCVTRVNASEPFSWQTAEQSPGGERFGASVQKCTSCDVASGHIRAIEFSGRHFSVDEVAFARPVPRWPAGCSKLLIDEPSFVHT